MIEKEVLGYQNYDWLSSFVLCDLYFATALREFLPDGQSCDPEANSVCAGAANVFSTAITSTNTAMGCSGWRANTTSKASWRNASPIRTYRSTQRG